MGVNFKQARLSNGLTIIAEVDPQAHSAAVGYFVKTGARDEATKVMGVSHFLEHMMFKGSANRSAAQINQAFDRIGAKNNAYTSAEMTCFYATVLPEKLLGEDGANAILADMLRPALRQDDFDTEKNVILEEIAMYQDNPFWVLFERTMEVYAGARVDAKVGDVSGMHPLGHRVLGTKESITDLTSGQMREYFNARYSADNTIVALAGNLDFDGVVEDIDRRCGSWARTDARRDPDKPRVQSANFVLRDAKVNRGYMLMLSPGPAMEDDQRYAAGMAAHVLGGADNSRLHWSLVETGIAEDCECAFDARDGVGDFLIYAVADPDRLDEVWAIIDRQIRELPGTIREEDLEKIRAKTVTGVTLAGERPGGRMQRLGRQWTYLGCYTTLEQELEKLNAVSVKQVQELLERYRFEPRTIGRLIPGSP